MAGFSHSIRKWFSPQPMDDIEWDEARKEYLEERVREICEPYVYDLQSISDGAEVELGQVAVPIRSRGMTSPSCLSGKVYLQRGDSGMFDVSIKVPRAEEGSQGALWPFLTWHFQSEEEAAAFVTPPSHGTLASLLAD